MNDPGLHGAIAEEDRAVQTQHEDEGREEVEEEQTFLDPR